MNMKKDLFCAVMAVAALAACNKQIDEIPEIAEPSVKLEITIPDGDTKATTVTGEGSVNSLQVFVFDKSGDKKLEAYKSVNGNSLELGVFSGQKIIHALVNAPALTGIVNYSDFYNSTSSLTDNSIGGFIMEGHKEVEIGNEKLSETINVKRVVSKVSLVKIENQLEAAYGNQTLQISKIYLINVVKERAYSAVGQTIPAPGNNAWLHKRNYQESDGIKTLAYDVLTNVKPTYTTPYNTSHYFYCYPNPVTQDSSASTWSPRKTRLVVEALLGGNTYYYPITLNVTNQNTEYQVSLIITRPGSSHPDIPYDPEAATISVNVLPWDSSIPPVEEVI